MRVISGRRAFMFHKKGLYAGLFLIFIFLINSPNLWACECGVKRTILYSFEESELVVVTKAVSIKKTSEINPNKKHKPYGVESTQMVVEKLYKGDARVGDKLTFAQGGGGDCIWIFDEKSIGQTYLFYLGKPLRSHPYFADNNVKYDEPMYYADECGRSARFEDAIDDLLYLDNLNKVRGRTRLSGSLKSLDEGNPTLAGREIKIKYITQVGDYYPIFAFFCNYPKLVADNYKRYLENLIRKCYGFKGVPMTLSFREK